jgi:hypothetical protein
LRSSLKGKGADDVRRRRSRRSQSTGSRSASMRGVADRRRRFSIGNMAVATAGLHVVHGIPARVRGTAGQRDNIGQLLLAAGFLLSQRLSQVVLALASFGQTGGQFRRGIENSWAPAQTLLASDTDSVPPVSPTTILNYLALSRVGFVWPN